MISVKRHAMTALAVVFFMALPISLAASEMQPRVNVDFSHPVNIGTKVIPPGQYQLVQLPGKTDKRQFDVVTPKGEHLGMTGLASSILDTGAGSPPETPSATHVVLKKINGNYYLSQIWIKGRHRGWQFLLPSNVQQQANNASSENVTGTLSR